MQIQAQPVFSPRFRWLIATATLFLTAMATAATAESLRTLTPAGQLSTLQVSGSGDDQLALVVGESAEIVPGTEGADADEPVALLSSASGNLTAIWLRRSENGSSLHLATRTETEWLGPYALLAGHEPKQFDTAPSLTTETDRLDVVLDDGTRLDLERQVVHVVWVEDDGDVRYSPLVLNDGAFVGWNEVLTVSSAFRAGHQDLSPAELPDGFEGLLHMAPSADGGVQLTLADSIFGRLGVVRLEVVPLAVEVLGQSVFDALLESADLYDPDDLSSVADEIAGHIVHIGARLELDPTVGDFLSANVADWLTESGAEYGWDLLGLADAGRAETLDLGRSVYSFSLPNASGDGSVTTLDVGDFLDDNGHRDDFARLVQVRVAADIATPEAIGTDSTVQVAADGSAMAISWVDGETAEVRWIENHGEGWSATKSLATSESLQTADIVKLIESSLR